MILYFWLLEHQLPRIHIYSDFSTRNQRNRYYFRCHRRFDKSRAVCLRIGYRGCRSILLECPGFLVAFLLTTLARSMRARSCTCSVCVRKLRLTLSYDVEGLFLLEKTSIAFVFVCSLSHYIKTLSLLA